MKSVRQAIAAIEALANTPIPGTPRIPGRVLYVALPGSGRKSRNVLSRRALQVLVAIERRGRSVKAAGRSAKGLTSQSIQKALRVNRNVVAGAIHELKQAGFVRSEAEPATR